MASPDLVTASYPTTHGDIYTIFSSPPRGSIPPSKSTILLLHGNSSSSKIFEPILYSALALTHNILAIDLPGHGRSTPATSPESTYTMRGYADAVLELVGKNFNQIQELTVLGWSLGGHIAIEMVALLATQTSPAVHIRGAMLVGTPPSNGKEQTSKGFRGDGKNMHLFAQETLTADEYVLFAKGQLVNRYEDWMAHGVRDTDGRSRRIMFEDFTAGRGVDQVRVVEERADVLWGVVNGGEEPFVDLNYLDRLKWGNLWKQRCIRMHDLGHVPFWEDRTGFEGVFTAFVEACDE